MATLPISDGSGNLTTFAWAFVLAVTAYPDNEEAQSELITVLACDLAFKHEGLPEYEEIFAGVKTFLPSLLHARPYEHVIKSMGEAIGEGWMAGRLLIFLLRAAAHHGELRPNVTKGVSVISQGYKNKRDGRGRHVYTSKRNVWENWQRYKSAAHFHAHFQLQLMIAEAEGREPPTDPSDLTDKLDETIAAAESFRRLAEQYRFVVPGELWSAPSDLVLPELEFEPGPLAGAELDLLKRYKPSSD